MKKVAILVLLALQLLMCGCASKPPNAITTNTSGNWEANLTGGTGAAADLNFVANFTVSNTTGEPAQGLTFIGFSFINNGPCFLTGVSATSQSGSATINTLSTSQVTGNMSMTITSNATSGTQAGSTLTLTSIDGVYGTSSGTTATNGTLSNGVVVGTWSLSTSSTLAANQAMCGTPTAPIGGTFIMCQNSATCVNPQ